MAAGLHGILPTKIRKSTKRKATVNSARLTMMMKTAMKATIARVISSKKMMMTPNPEAKMRISVKKAYLRMRWKRELRWKTDKRSKRKSKRKRM